MFIEGLLVVLDLDEFGDFMKERGWDPYRPNIVTGTLTSLVEAFARKWRGVVVYGLDHERGTEEAVIEIPYGYERLEAIVKDLEEIKREVNKYGASISIVALRELVYPVPARNRREAYYGTPGRRRALKILRSIKRAGGNKIVVIA
ncbi:MAG: hypothetical protein DRO13_04380 [Thermoprotei archaeon]|nr:MAG: hypothetical protein DRO13_04380 [Thermoprotei archaeon]